jgi:glycosyltransferase involved in cell wall biosynthesis
MTKIAIISKTVPIYRRDFYNELRRVLSENKIELLLLYGQPSRRDALKNDTTDIEWAVKVPSKIWEFGRTELYWQPILSYLKDVDLVIVEQASKLLINYVLLLQYWLKVRKLAFWGHGKNFQEKSANRLGEWIKRRVSTRIHWWFAYNEMSALVVREMGFPPERITSVQNAIDTRALTQALENLTLKEIEKTRTDLNLHSANVGIYAGGLYPEKRLSFLLESLHLIRRQIPDFEMIFIGGGVDAPMVEQAAAQYSWIHYVGPKFDREKVPYFAISKLFLMPGLVGLGILDTFALETPLVTTQIPLHSPEISYLQNDVNGLMVDNASNPQVYADAVIRLLLNEDARQKLVDGCISVRNVYTIEIMVSRFAQGIIKSLESQ